MFKCNKCGLCCKHAEESLKQYSEILGVDINFPYKFINGGCEKLKHNKCTVYNSRPDICSTSYVYENIYKSHVNEEDYYNELKKYCNEIIDKHKMSKKYKYEI